VRNLLRSGFVVWNNACLLGRGNPSAFNKLFLLSESPVRYAVEATNPGSQRKRIFYPATISPTVDAWPMVYRSEDILIREIPAEQPSPVNDTSPPQ
jgi:hypothetical protein